MQELIYEYTNNKVLNARKVKAILEYLEVHKTSLIEIGDFVFDLESLNTPIMLNKCLECEKYQSENCCQGSPYSMPDYQVSDLKSIVHKVLSFMPDGQIENRYLCNTDLVFTRGNSVTAKGNREDGCIFSYHTKEGIPKCAIHAFCLENSLNPNQYKPFICSLFPLFAVRFPSNKVIFFCHNQETEPFSFYWYTLTRRPCVNIKTLDRVINSPANEVFKSKYLNTLHKNIMISDGIKSQYIPAWKAQSSILKYLVSDDVYNELSLEEN